MPHYQHFYRHNRNYQDFAVKCLIEDVQSAIDPQQFGSLKGSSTTYCLLDMFENWLSSLDQPSQYLRICFLDFSKAFDHIDHNSLVRKLLGLGVRRHLIFGFAVFSAADAKLLNSVLSYLNGSQLMQVSPKELSLVQYYLSS